MLHFPRWKTLSIIATLLVSLILIVPNFLSKEQQDVLKGYGLRPVTLGLDLQGGSNVLLEVDQKDLRDKLSQQLVGDIRSTLREAKIGYSGISRNDNGVSVRITKPEDLERARTQLATLQQPLETGMLGSGVQANLLDLAQNDQQFSLTFSQAGIDAKIASAISQSLKIIESRVNALGTAESQPTAPGQNPPAECDSLTVKETPDQKMWVQTSTRATVDGADLVDARPAFDQQNQPVVSFRFNTRGAERFAKLTTENVGRPFAIILDSEVVSAPNINEPIIGGAGQISGNFTTQEASDLAIVLRSGALPAKLTIVEERTVGPSLGSDSIRAGLTMGMAVDSNVLIFERIREEWRNGRSVLSSLETGFKAALGTIVDSNVTTLIAAAVLFGVGSGPVRGFAVTLSIGIITTMFTAFTLTQLIVAVWYSTRRPKEVPL